MAAEPTTRPDAKKIIDTVVEALREGIEHFDDEFSLVPADYEVLLHRDAYDELQSIFPYIVDRAQVQLDKELERLNTTGPPHQARRFATWLKRLVSFRWLHRAADASARKLPVARYKRAGYGWQLRFNMTLDPSADLGYVAVVAELAAPQPAEAFAGPVTRRLTVRGADGRYRTQTLRPDAPSLSVSADGAAAPAGEVTQRTVRPATPVAEAGGYGPLATLAFKDDDGPQTYTMTAREIAVGRGGEGADHLQVVLNTVRDVSREHLRIRYVPQTRAFEVKDVSSLGTTVNGRLVAPSIDKAGGRDLDRWEPLPDRATIGLAGVILIDFERVSSDE